MAYGAAIACEIELAWPAPRVGYYTIKCSRCGLRINVNTLGHLDDVKTVRLPCGPNRKEDVEPVVQPVAEQQLQLLDYCK